MINKIARYLYKFALSIFMAYLIIKSIWIFTDYAMNHEKKFSAYTEIEIQTEQPATRDKLAEMIPHERTEIEKLSSERNWLLTLQAPRYEDLEGVKEKVISSLNEKLTTDGFQVQRSELFPPPVSKHYFRLQMTVFIPGFIIAIFWFVHFYRWSKNELKGDDEKKQS